MSGPTDHFFSKRGGPNELTTGRADPVPEAPTRVRSGEGNNRSKVLPPQKFCRETASNPGPGDSAS
jgi:hypothetical protein